MNIETFKHFKYEIALGAEIPMPKPAINYYPHDQYTVQQYLHTLCKLHVGSLGKRGGKWAFGDDAPDDARLSSRPEIISVFDFAEKMGIIEPAPSEGGPAADDPEAFIPYKLSQKYWDSFDKFAK